MKIDILGTGCAKCKALFEVAKEALAKSGKFAEINKIEDIVEIMSYGVTSTPALVVDGEVKMSGRVPSVDEVVEIIST
jgi:small redox-active disulfide protein 2